MARRATKTQKKSGSLWRKILLATFLLALAVIGSAAYVLFSPVTPQNVNSRLAGICRVGIFAVQIKATGNAGREELKAGTCGCLAKQVTDKLSPAIAARATESFRKLIIYRLKNKLTFQDGKEKSALESGLSQAAINEFVERFSEAAKTCNSGQT